VPIDNWKTRYAETIRQIFEQVNPERITLGTLRFEAGFYNMRHTLFTTGPELPAFLEEMHPMLPAENGPGGAARKSGKYSFDEQKRVEIFSFAVNEIRKYSTNCRIALCKESAGVWEKVGLPLSRCSCVCQLD